MDGRRGHVGVLCDLSRPASSYYPEESETAFSPRFFISIGLLVTASADIMFALVSILDVIDEEWISNLLYDAANMTIVEGLYWYYKHIVSFGTKAKISKTSPDTPPQLVKIEKSN